MGMRVAFALFLTIHALIHIVGFAKAFGLASVSGRLAPISRAAGVIWISATFLFLCATASIVLAPRAFWVVAILGTIVSQFAIAKSWKDARFGTLPNVAVLLCAIYAAFAWGPFGLRAEYESRTAARLVRLSPNQLLTERDLEPLPPQIQRYLRYVGVVGHPRVSAFRVHFRGRIRSGPDAPWMEFTGQQQNFADSPARFFSMDATMHGLPVYGLHAYENEQARMQVKVLSLFSVVDAAGTDFTKTETVTLFNDMCIMAPATLVDPNIGWREVDAQHVVGTYTNGRFVIHATLSFDETGALVNFWSDDRPSLAADGTHFVAQRWSTPIGGFRSQGAFRLPSRGEGRYGEGANEYAYIQFDDLDVSYAPM